MKNVDEYDQLYVELMVMSHDLKLKKKEDYVECELIPKKEIW